MMPPKVAKPHPLDLEIQQRFLALDQPNMIQAEYVWIGGNNELRCKTKTLDKEVTSASELPVWNFDGSSTEQAPGTDSEVLLVPCAIYKDPFRAGPTGSSKNIIVLCDCYKPDPRAPGLPSRPIRASTASRLWTRLRRTSRGSASSRSTRSSSPTASRRTAGPSAASPAGRRARTTAPSAARTPTAARSSRHTTARASTPASTSRASTAR